MKLKSNIIIFFISFFFLFLFIDIGEAFAEEAGRNIVAQIINKFKEQNAAWHAPIKDAATHLFYLILFLEFAWSSIKAALHQMSTQDFFINLIMITISGCFFIAVINNYQEWSNAIVNGLNGIINDNIGNDYQADEPFNIALDIYGNINKITSSMTGIDYIATLLACYLCMMVIMIIFALITAKVIVVHCEVLIGMLGSMLLLPFGASQLFKEFAINSMKYILSVGFKLFILNLIIAVSFTFIKGITFSKTGLLFECIALVGFSMVLLCLVFTLPDTIASLVSSAHGTSGGMLQAINTVMNTITAGAAVAGTTIHATTAPAKGTGKAGFQIAAARNLARESMMEKGADGKYTDASKWNNLSKFGKTKATFGTWNEARKQANANNSTIYKEIKNNQIMLQNTRAYA